jgi:hypothetical protein
MNQAFLKIAKKITEEKRKKVTVAYVKVRGWLGHYEYKHGNAIITTLPNLEELLENAKVPYKIINF